MASLEPKATATSGEGASLLAAWEARKARAFADGEVTVLTRGDMVIASVTSNPNNLRLERERG